MQMRFVTAGDVRRPLWWIRRTRSCEQLVQRPPQAFVAQEARCSCSRHMPTVRTGRNHRVYVAFGSPSATTQGCHSEVSGPLRGKDPQSENWSKVDYLNQEAIEHIQYMPRKKITLPAGSKCSSLSTIPNQLRISELSRHDLSPYLTVHRKEAQRRHEIW